MLSVQKGAFMLKLNDGYIFRKINGIPYLFPYGQNIADFRRSIRLNESGTILYRAIADGADEQDLLLALSSHYQAKASDLPALKGDIDLFLSQLAAADVLSRTDHTAADCMPDCYLRVGTLTIAYCGPKELLYAPLLDFLCQSCEPDLTFRVINAAPATKETAKILVRTEDLTILKNETAYILLYPKRYGILEARISLDGTSAHFFCAMPFDTEHAEKLFHAFRFAFLIHAQQKGFFALHSASIFYREKAWLFCAPSGVGKSTHTELWRRLYYSRILNGDLNLVGFSNNQEPVVCGIPWCGTSGLYTTENIPLGGIVFLKQSGSDQVLTRTTEDAILHTIWRTISPSWTEEMLRLTIASAEKLSKAVPFFHLQCTKEPSAVYLIKEQIDAFLEQKN